MTHNEQRQAHNKQPTREQRPNETQQTQRTPRNETNQRQQPKLVFMEFATIYIYTILFVYTVLSFLAFRSFLLAVARAACRATPSRIGKALEVHKDHFPLLVFL